jgi:hypothetical protein
VRNYWSYTMLVDLLLSGEPRHVLLRRHQEHRAVRHPCRANPCQQRPQYIHRRGAVSTAAELLLCATTAAAAAAICGDGLPRPALWLSPDDAATVAAAAAIRLEQCQRRCIRGGACVCAAAAAAVPAAGVHDGTTLPWGRPAVCGAALCQVHTLSAYVMR